MLIKSLFAVLAALAAVRAELRVVPEPASFTTGNTTLCLSQDFYISVEGDGGKAPADLTAANTDIRQRLFANTHQYLSPKHGQEFFSDGKGCAGKLSNLILRYNNGAKVQSIAADAQTKIENRNANEAYTLEVPESGPAVITADTSIGLYRGLTTFENLFYSTKAGGASYAEADGSNWRRYLRVEKHEARNNQAQIYAPYAPYKIEDKPAFPWRAVLLDSSRHYLPKSVIKKQIDAFAAVKINVFHWHIVDSQSFPLYLDSVPELAKLAENAAYSPAQIYNENDVKEIVDYAGARGVDVVIEIDTPGHTAAVWETYPELIAGFVQHPWSTWANEPPSGQLRFADPATITFTQKLFKATAGLLKSPYFGTGGDEINAVCVSNDTQTEEIYKKNGWLWDFTNATTSAATLSQALKPFTEQTHQTIRDLGRTPVVWDEMAIEFDSGIGNDTLIQAWRGPESTAGVINKGFRVIMADYNYFYLDCGQGGWVTGNPDTDEPQTLNINSWCDPYKTWMKVIDFNPFVNLTDSQKELVVGGQASLWAEQVDANNLDAQLWPRAAAFAEVWWTGGGEKGFPRDAVSAVARIHDIRYRLDARGFRAIAIQPEWCALRPGQCNLLG